MPDRFRYLINMDQCLNMSHYDMFFYRLESRNLFRAFQAQLKPRDQRQSLRHAVANVRKHLTQHAYTVDEYEIIGAMRISRHRREPDWQDTILFRLLQFHWELQQAGIHVVNQQRMHNAVDLILLHDASFDAHLDTRQPDYLTSDRLSRDCELMFRQVGLSLQTALDAQGAIDALRSRAERILRENGLPTDGLTDAAAIANTLARYALRLDSDEVPLLHMLCSFVARHSNKPLAGQAPATQDAARETRILFLSFLNDELSNYRVLERFMDRDDMRHINLSLLRVVEYINRPLAEPDGVQSLSERCRASWNAVQEDEGLEERYARMLGAYQDRLDHVITDLETSDFQPKNAEPLPALDPPGSDEITVTDGLYTKSLEKTPPDELALKGILPRFRNRIRSGGDLRALWAETRDQIEDDLEDPELKLQIFGQKLSAAYARELELRHRHTMAWTNPNTTFRADADTVSESITVQAERKQLLKELTAPHMRQTVTYQDRLNMEHALDICDQRIRFHIACLNALTAACLIGVLLLVLLPFLLHYVLLQPYVFTSSELLLYALIYIAAVVVALIPSLPVPKRHFLRCIEAEADALEVDLETYLIQYFKQADYFRTYINRLNKLDYLTRYGRLLQRTLGESAGYGDRCRMHLARLKEHKEKVLFFEDLVGLPERQPRSGNALADLNVGDAIDKLAQTDDVVDCEVYWPQH